MKAHLTCIVYPPTGLGDGIILNGLVRKQREWADRVVYLCRLDTAADLRVMYRDDPGITVQPFRFQHGMSVHTKMRYLKPVLEKWSKRGPTKLLCPQIRGPRYGVDMPTLRHGQPFDRFLYEVVGESFDVKYTHFKYVRDPVAEAALIKRVLGKPPYAPFAFVHDKHRAKIPLRRITKGLRIVRPVRIPGQMFHYAGIIDLAQEVHVIDSSFLNMIDMLKLQRPYMHLWNRRRSNAHPHVQLNWDRYARIFPQYRPTLKTGE